MNERPPLTFALSKTSPKDSLKPCNVCEFQPEDCGKQAVQTTGSGRRLILCMIGKGEVKWVRENNTATTVKAETAETL